MNEGFSVGRWCGDDKSNMEPSTTNNTRVYLTPFTFHDSQEYFILTFYDFELDRIQIVLFSDIQEVFISKCESIAIILTSHDG